MIYAQKNLTTVNQSKYNSNKDKTMERQRS